MPADDLVFCACGCGKWVKRRTEKLHLQQDQITAPSLRGMNGRQKLREFLRRSSSIASARAHAARSEADRNYLDIADNPVQPPSPPAPDGHYVEEMIVDMELPHTEANVWDDVMLHRQQALLQSTHSKSRRTTSGSHEDSTTVGTEDLEDLDSIETLSDRYFGVDVATHGLTHEVLMREEFLVDLAAHAFENLEPEDLEDLMTFDFFVKYQPTEALYQGCRDRFRLKDSTRDLPSIKTLRTRARVLSGLSAKVYDCCINSCVAYIGYTEKLTICPYCNEPRYDSTGKCRNFFTYVALIPQLRALFCCPETSEKMRYRHLFDYLGDSISDIFHSKRYKHLRHTKVIIDGKEQPYCYFEEEHEIALGLCTDGLCPFKRRKQTCWPIVLVNYNLPPEERTRTENLICVGVVPGPKCPADLNSYLQPLIEELIELAHGTPAVDVSQRKLFALRAHLITVFGDIPAMTKLLEFIGHNGCYPCRFCMIPTVSGTTSGGGTHRYCPLQQPDGHRIDPLNLPLRTHEECLKQGLDVLRAPTDNARSKLASKSGIKGVSLLARLSSISIPVLFPVDLMHMIWQNLIPQLLDLWTKQFNELDEGLEDYCIDSNVWDAIGKACQASGDTIPSSFGCRVPHFDKRSQFIAETWSNFTLLLSPCLLRRRFRNPRYYTHFIRLVKLLRLIVSFDLPREELDSIRQGFADWVEEYEQIYYQFDADRLQTCPVNLHYLLHIADSIEHNGPVWCYWAYPMERFCSFVSRAIKSRRYPYANIDQRVLDRARLFILLLKYNLRSQVPFKAARRVDEAANATIIPAYPHICLLTPHSEPLLVTPELKRKIVRYLTTSFGVRSREAEMHIPEHVDQWGRFQIANGGDLIHARGYHKLKRDGRDASFVRYELLVDLDADKPHAPERLERQSQYGQLQHIFTLQIPGHTKNINPSRRPRTLLLALILEATVQTDDRYEHEVIWYKGKLGTGEVVDATTIQCAVGRAFDNKIWWIIDRSAGNQFTYPEFT